MAAACSKPPCPQAECLVKAGLRAQVLVPADADYTARQDTYWSTSAKVKPACIVRPRSAEEVSITVKTLVAVGEKFAVRSGGHSQWAGSNNIEAGVTIDLSLLDSTKLDEASETVDLGPGGRWREVYAELHKHGRVVAGGREGNVGVAGLILGGGNTFLTARRGFACDNVIAYEVVLADGRIIIADANNHDDLFQALKGGSNNFGIVTNFKMNAIKCDKVWGGVTFFPKHIAPDAIQALSEFTNNVANDVDSNLLLFFTHMGMSDRIPRSPSLSVDRNFWSLCSYLYVMISSTDSCAPDFRDIVIATMYVQVAGVEKAPSYEKWLGLPSIMTTCKLTSVSDIASDYNLPSQYYNTWFTATFKNDPRIVARASELHEKLVEEFKALIPDGDFITQCLFQPLPQLFGQRSAESGGNVMGVERQDLNGLLFLAVAMVRTAEQEIFAYSKVKGWVQAVKEFATTIDHGNLQWIYLNYADKSQDPLASYGVENVKKMRDVAAKYDPAQVFQKLCPGGFKISDVKD